MSCMYLEPFLAKKWLGEPLKPKLQKESDGGAMNDPELRRFYSRALLSRDNPSKVDPSLKVVLLNSGFPSNVVPS